MPVLSDETVITTNIWGVQTTAHDFRERIRAGIVLLDKKSPQGWRNRINPERLDMGSRTDDVLGQIYGSYRVGYYALFGASSNYWPNPWLQAAYCGFIDIERTEAEYSALRELWLEALS